VKPIKCYVLAVWCAWNGHEPTDGTRYSWVLGRRVKCVCCSRCRKVLAHEVTDRL
jgi:hypothetical protein